jgi:hypothetical protein
MDVVRNVNYSLQRRSGRLKGMRKVMPVAKAAEAFVCRGLGIVQNGEEVTELAMKELARRFDGEIPDHVLATLRELFGVSSQADEEVVEALLRHGGAAGLELGVAGGDDAANV